MRLIDADALKLADFQDFSNTDVFAAIDAQPTVDAVPVVRCQECKHHQENEWFHYCKRLGVYVPDDPKFFCSDGERKEADHDEKAD